MATPFSDSDRPIVLFLVIVAALEIVFFAIAWLTGVQVGENYLPTLLSAKITFISLLTATLTFLYRGFWDEVRALPRSAPSPAGPEVGSTPPRGIPPAALLGHYQLYTLMLLSAIFSTFVAIVMDILIAVGQTEPLLRSVSFSTILTAFVLMILFVFYFARRTVGEMRSVLAGGYRG